MKYIVVIDVDLKEDSVTYPDAIDVRRRLRDVLCDVTKHDETIDWRVVAIESLSAGIFGSNTRT